MIIGILPTMTERHTVLENLSPNLAICSSTPRSSRRAVPTCRSTSVASSACGPRSTRSRPKPPVRACSFTCRSRRSSSRTTGTHRSRSPACSSPSVRTRPYLYGRQLWAETRIALFEQATDTRPDEMKSQGVRPRVWFGERWITSIFDLFEENLRYFPTLLPICDTEDPVEVVRDGGVPRLAELRLQNGTIYRWNRPVYDVMNARPHLRVENRVLPAGPTVVDMLANAAFYFGLVRELADADRPIWNSLTFGQAETNFFIGARDGIDSRMYWPRLGEISSTELVLDHLLPKAYAGLDRFGVSTDIRDRLLGIIEGRCRLRRNGATWQVQTVRRLQEAGYSRAAALREMVRRYADQLGGNEPVHLWDID